MSVYTHKGTGGEKLVSVKRGEDVQRVRADSLRHYSGKCSALRATMRNSGMAVTDNTASLRERTVPCANEGCWDLYGTHRGEDSLAAGVRKVMHPALLAIINANVKERKALAAAAKRDAAKKSAAKVKRAPAKKSAAKRAPAKKSAAKKSAPAKEVSATDTVAA